LGRNHPGIQRKIIAYEARSFNLIASLATSLYCYGFWSQLPSSPKVGSSSSPDETDDWTPKALLALVMYIGRLSTPPTLISFAGRKSITEPVVQRPLAKKDTWISSLNTSQYVMEMRKHLLENALWETTHDLFMKSNFQRSAKKKIILAWRELGKIFRVIPRPQDLGEPGTDVVAQGMDQLAIAEPDQERGLATWTHEYWEQAMKEETK
jgi:hypothetical protein